MTQNCKVCEGRLPDVQFTWHVFYPYVRQGYCSEACQKIAQDVGVGRAHEIARAGKRLPDPASH